MLKLNAGFSRKVGEPNYGSRGASVNVELEVESSLVGEPQSLLGRIQHLFDLARQSVDDELARPATNGNTPSQSNPITPAGRPNNGHREFRPATSSQIRAIRAICQRQKLDPSAIAHQRFAVSSVDELSLQEASNVIDALKAEPAPARNGGGR